MKNEILELEAEELSNNPLEAVIEKELTKHNVTDALINSLSEKYSGLKLRTIDDKEMYLDIKSARNEVRKVGILVEKICKAGREEAVAIQKKWLNKEKEVGAKVLKVQDPLDAEIKKFEDEEARLELIKKEAEAERLAKRQSALYKLGATYEGGNYVSNHISYEASNIQEVDDEFFEKIILPKYQAQFDAKQKEITDAENKRKEEADQLKKQQEELQRQQAEMKRQQDELNQQKAEHERLLLEQKQRAEKVLSDRYQTRINHLNGHAFYFNKDADQFEYKNGTGQVGILTDEIKSLEDGAWETKFSDLRDKAFEFKKAQKELDGKRHEAEALRLQEEAATKERERIIEEQRLSEIKKQEEEALKVEELAKASDKEKLAAYIKAIKDVPVPTFKSKSYKDKMQAIKNTINSL